MQNPRCLLCLVCHTHVKWVNYMFNLPRNVLTFQLLLPSQSLPAFGLFRQPSHLCRSHKSPWKYFFHTIRFLQHPPHPPCCRQVCLEGWCDSGRSWSSHYGRLNQSHFSQSENVRSATAVYLVRGSLIFASNKMSHSKIIHLLLPVLQGDNWLVAPPAYFRLLFWETIDAKRSSSYL